MIDKKIKRKALELSQKERAKLAHMLIDSLNPEVNYESAEEWPNELRNRINQYEKGASSVTSWQNVKKKGMNMLNK